MLQTVRVKMKKDKGIIKGLPGKLVNLNFCGFTDQESGSLIPETHLLKTLRLKIGCMDFYKF